jgi:serine/threonine protein kinase
MRLTDRTQRVPRAPDAVREGVPRRAALEAHPRDGLGRIRRRHVRSLSHAYTHTTHTHSARSSALDEISGETVAIKQVTRVLDKVPLAKRALREITLLRHFANHENITGLIDLDAISPDFNEMCVRHPILVPAR